MLRQVSYRLSPVIRCNSVIIVSYRAVIGKRYVFVVIKFLHFSNRNTVVSFVNKTGYRGIFVENAKYIEYVPRILVM